jgi:hypothetical protein
VRSAGMALAPHEPVALNEETAVPAALAEVVAGHSHIVASAAGHVGRHRVQSDIYLRAAYPHVGAARRAKRIEAGSPGPLGRNPPS